MATFGGLAQLAGDLAARALDLALPPTCSGCGREGAALCRECRSILSVRLASTPGAPIGLLADVPPPLVQLEWCAPFTGVARRAIHDLKYSGERRLARPLGEAIAARWARAGAGGEVIVPVPASPDRIRERGYDQAVLLADVAAARLRLPLLQLLERTHDTAAQFGLDRGTRADNVGRAFAVRGGVAELVRDRSVVLVDDVVTTGSTLGGCATVLLDAGALAVSAVTVARER
jgi:competence protein ComFC